MLLLGFTIDPDDGGWICDEARYEPPPVFGRWSAAGMSFDDASSVRVEMGLPYAPSVSH